MKVILLLVAALLLCLPRIGRANNFTQGSVMSDCPLGSPEAEEIYQEGRRYWLGQEGRKRNPKKAQELFEQAMFMGNSKAPICIGGLYMWEYQNLYAEKDRFRFMIRMYNEGVKMGCAEGHVFLAECYFNGWGVPASDKKAVEELKQAIAKASPKGMEIYGNYLVRMTKQIEAGRELLRRSLALGNGDAAYPLAYSYYSEKNNDCIYAAIRTGAKLGSLNALGTLSYYYLQGAFGQKKNKELSDCVEKVKKTVNWFYAPKPIENFDELCPHPTPLNVTP